MKNRPVSISANQVFDFLLFRYHEGHSHPSDIFRRAVHNIEELVNLKRMEAGNDFDSMQLAREELGYLFGVSSSLFDEITLEED